MEKLQAELDGLHSELGALAEAIAKFSANTAQLAAEAESKDAENLEREEQYKVRKQVLDMLPNADENIRQLQEVVDGSASRLIKLTTKWDEHRSGLLDTLRKLKVGEGEGGGGRGLDVTRLLKCFWLAS